MSDSLLPIGTRVMETQASRDKHGEQARGTRGRIMEVYKGSGSDYVYRVHWGSKHHNSYREIDVEACIDDPSKFKEDV